MHRREFSHWLRNRSERGIREPSGLDVVESNDGDIVWNALPEAREGFGQEDCLLVVSAHDGVRACAAPEKSREFALVCRGDVEPADAFLAS